MSPPARPPCSSLAGGHFVPPAVPLESLLAHREWVRTLALSLTDRAADADDVEQQTWLAALTAAPSDVRSVRAWLTTVAANAARKLRRTDARQRSRAERRPPPAPARSAADLAEEADTHARVVTAVVALDEPYRQAVLLRYFEGLGVPDVARRTGVPLETARSRLHRARAMLRDRLAADLGPDRPRRLAALAGAELASPAPRDVRGLPSPAAAPSVPLPIAGVTLMATKVAAAAGVAVVLVGAWLIVSSHRAGPPGPSADGDRAALPASHEAPGAAPAGARPRERAAAPAAPVAMPSPPASAADDAPAAPRLSASDRLRRRLEEVDPILETLVLDQPTGPEVFGRIADATDCPVVLTRRAEAALVANPLPSGFTFSGRTDGERLLLTIPPLAGLTHVVQEDRVVIHEPGETVGLTTEIVVPPRPSRPAPVRVHGTTRDATGAPVAAAEIRLFDGIERVVATAAADGAWTFERRGLGSGGLVFVLARAPARVGSPGVRLAAPVPETAIDLVLGGPGGTLRVRVVGDAGPVDGARVQLGPDEARATTDSGGRSVWDLPRSATTASDGTCTFDGVAPGTAAIRVAKAGLQPAGTSAAVVAGETASIDVGVGPRPSLAARLAETRVSARFSGARLHDVVSYLTRVSGVNVVVLPDLAASATAPVSLTLADEPLGSALRSLCDQIPGAEIDVRDAEGLVVLRSRAEGK